MFLLSEQIDREILLFVHCILHFCEFLQADPTETAPATYTKRKPVPESDPEWKNDDVYDNQNHHFYPETMRQAKRYGISINALVDIMNAMKIDEGKTDKSGLLSNSKVRSMMRRLGFEDEIAHDDIGNVQEFSN